MPESAARDESDRPRGRLRRDRGAGRRGQQRQGRRSRKLAGRPPARSSSAGGGLDDHRRAPLPGSAEAYVAEATGADGTPVVLKVMVDPDGVRAEPECDLGTLMRADPVELLLGEPRDRAQRLAELTGPM